MPGADEGWWVMTAEEILIDAAAASFIAAAKFLVAAGKDPKALLNAELDAADIAAFAELAALPDDEKP
jgi:hypothetical protein